MRLAQLAALGGSAILLVTAIAGCSDSTPLPEKGGFSVELVKTAACPVQSGNVDVGSGTGTLTSTDPGAVATDGTDNATITCSVSGTSTFAVDVQAIQQDNSLHAIIPSISKKNTMDNPAKGSVSFSGLITSGTAYSSSECTFWFQDKEEVETGKVWASFSCDTITGGTNSCALSSGTIVFYNCATAAPTQ